MALVRWKPNTVFDFGRELDRIFDSFRSRDNGWSATAWSPAVDVKESDEEIEVSAELPGLDKENIDVSATDGVLTLKGEKKYEKESEDEDVHRTERAYGSFSRAFTLPAEVKADEISAEYKDGVLTVKLPKAEAAKARRIEVKAA